MADALIPEKGWVPNKNQVFVEVNKRGSAAARYFPSFSKRQTGSGLRYVAGVNWPRSGHHLLVRLLEHYFGGRFRYCEFYSPELDCCRSFPCGRRGMPVNLSKNHDFDLRLPELPDIPYLVQYRAFLPSVQSNYERHLLNIAADTKEAFQDFALAQLQSYGAFRAKWVAGSGRAHKLIIKYEDLISDPLPVLSAAIRFFAPAEVIDRERLSGLVATISGETVENRQDISKPGQGVRETRRLEAFRHYDASFFAKLEAGLPEEARLR